jgi:uncharacterized membrane protein YeiH
MQLAADGGYLVTGLAIHAMIHPLQVPLWIDLTSVIVAALAGAAVAVEERFDPLGGILLAMVMGLGGGIIRDLLLGLRPVAVTSHYYLPAVTVAALGGYVFASLLRLGTPFVVLDAMATGLFTVVGVEKALLYDLPDVSAIFIGVAAAVGGGLFVDLIAGRPVGVVHRGPWNATAALAGAAFYTVVADLDAPIGFRQAATLAVVVVMRLASLRWGLQTPLPDDLVRKFTPRRRQGDADAPQDIAGGDTSVRHQVQSRSDPTRRRHRCTEMSTRLAHNGRPPVAR